MGYNDIQSCRNFVSRLNDMYLICMKGYYNMDLTSPRTIRNIQEQFGFTFKKGLGQNFLTARNILEEIVDAAEIESDSACLRASLRKTAIRSLR